MRRSNISRYVDSRAELDAVYRIFIRDLELVRAQDGADLLASIDLVVDRPEPIDADRYRKVVCYDTAVKTAKALAADRGISSLAHLADRLVARCFDDPRVRTASVRIRPGDATAGDAGFETTRRRDRAQPGRLKLAGAR